MPSMVYTRYYMPELWAVGFVTRYPPFPHPTTLYFEVDIFGFMLLLMRIWYLPGYRWWFSRPG